MVVRGGKWCWELGGRLFEYSFIMIVIYFGEYGNIVPQKIIDKRCSARSMECEIRCIVINAES